MKNTIKKLLIITIYIGLIFISTKVYATSAGTVLNNSTRIRKEASTSSDVVTILSKNTEVKIDSEEGEWYKVTYKSYTGYIRKDMLKVATDTTTNSATTNTTNNTSTTNTAENTETNTTTNTTANNTENTITNSTEEQTQNTTITDNNTETENTANETKTTTSSETNKEILQKGYKGSLSTSIGVKVLPTINSSIIETLSENTQFTITDVINKWCYIETENNSGWVLLSKIESKADNSVEETKNSEISVENSQENEETENKEEVEENTEKETQATNDTKNETTKEDVATYKYVSTETLNLRETPDNNAKIVTQLTLNTQVTVIEVVDSTWIKVKAKGSTGYVASKFLSDSKTEKTSRSESETRTNSTTTSQENTTLSSSTTANTDSSKNTTTSNASSSTTTSNNSNNSSNSSASNNSSTSSTTGASVVAYAKQYLGYKYVSGGTSPSTGFDCSGFTYYVYKHFGITLNRTSTAQIQNGTAVSKSNLKEGDILIFNNSANTAIGHVGIYIGGNTFIHAANSTKGVITTSLSDSYYSARYVATRRIIN